jgi:hypothetical protein
VIWSAAAAQSRWVLDELFCLTERRNRDGVEIAIVRIEDVEVPPLQRQLQRIDVLGSRDAERVAARFLTGVLPPDSGPPTVTVTVDEISDDACLLLAGQLVENVLDIASRRHPDSITVQIGPVSFQAQINVQALTLPGVLDRISGALELIAIHQQQLKRLREIQADLNFFAFPQDRQIKKRLDDIASETRTIRQALALFVVQAWKSVIPRPGKPTVTAADASSLLPEQAEDPSWPPSSNQNGPGTAPWRKIDR